MGDGPVILAEQGTGYGMRDSLRKSNDQPSW